VSGCVAKYIGSTGDPITSVGKTQIHEMKIWPNPVVDYLYFGNKNQPFLAKIANMEGKTIRSFDAVGDRIFLGDLKPGIYILHFYWQGAYYSAKVVKQ